MSYSRDYREQTIEYRHSGHTLEETHQVFKVSISTIREWEKRLKERGDLEKNELHRNFRKIDPEKLKAYVEEHPDAYSQRSREEVKRRREKMTCSEAEDAGGLAPAKDDNEAARFFIRRTLPILDCVDYISRKWQRRLDAAKAAFVTRFAAIG